MTPQTFTVKEPQISTSYIGFTRLTSVRQLIESVHHGLSLCFVQAEDDIDIWILSHSNAEDVLYTYYERHAPYVFDPVTKDFYSLIVIQLNQAILTGQINMLDQENKESQTLIDSLKQEIESLKDINKSLHADLNGTLISFKDEQTLVESLKQQLQQHKIIEASYESKAPATPTSA